jgi:hypothetical protein
MLTATGRFTGQRAMGPHVLAIQGHPRNSTSLATPDSKHGFGRSGNDSDLGLFLHPTNEGRHNAI